MSYLPRLKSGFAYRGTLYKLLSIYYAINCHLENVYITPDDLLNETFGESNSDNQASGSQVDYISSEFYRFKWKSQDDNWGAPKIMEVEEMITMTYAIDNGLIPYPLSTFDAVKLQYPDFNQNYFPHFFFEHLVDYNCYNLEFSKEQQIRSDNEYRLMDSIRSTLGLEGVWVKGSKANFKDFISVEQYTGTLNLIVRTHKDDKLILLFRINNWLNSRLNQLILEFIITLHIN